MKNLLPIVLTSFLAINTTSIYASTSSAHRSVNTTENKLIVANHNKELKEKVKNILKTQLGVDKEHCTDSTRLVEDLGANEQDWFEIIMAIEDEFNIKITESECDVSLLQGCSNIKTVQDLVNLVNSKLKN